MTAATGDVWRWTWRDTLELHGRAIVWMLLVTLPIAVFLGFLVLPFLVEPSMGASDGGPWWSRLASWLYGVVIVDLVSILFVLLAAIVCLPFTYGLGRLLERVRNHWLQVAATSALAGSLAAVATLSVDTWASFVAGPVVVGAGGAGALARHAQLRRRAARATEATAAREVTTPETGGA